MRTQFRRLAVLLFGLVFLVGPAAWCQSPKTPDQSAAQSATAQQLTIAEALPASLPVDADNLERYYLDRGWPLPGDAWAVIGLFDKDGIPPDLPPPKFAWGPGPNRLVAVVAFEINGNRRRFIIPASTCDLFMGGPSDVDCLTISANTTDGKGNAVQPLATQVYQWNGMTNELSKLTSPVPPTELISALAGGDYRIASFEVKPDSAEAILESKTSSGRSIFSMADEKPISNDDSKPLIRFAMATDTNMLVDNIVSEKAKEVLRGYDLQHPLKPRWVLDRAVLFKTFGVTNRANSFDCRIAIGVHQVRRYLPVQATWHGEDGKYAREICMLDAQNGTMRPVPLEKSSRRSIIMFFFPHRCVSSSEGDTIAILDREIDQETERVRKVRFQILESQTGKNLGTCTRGEEFPWILGVTRDTVLLATATEVLKWRAPYDRDPETLLAL